MITPRLTHCKECTDIYSLLKDIDCKLTLLAKDLYNNITLALNRNISMNVYSDLLHYKRILTYKVCNPEYAEQFTVYKIASKIKLLKYK
jgi:hypothetical protein